MIARAMLLVFIALGLGACGIKGDPIPPSQSAETQAEETTE
ncbi:MAG: lipoprotein [Pseudomonadota bacterium]